MSILDILDPAPDHHCTEQFSSESLEMLSLVQIFSLHQWEGSGYKQVCQALTMKICQTGLTISKFTEEGAFKESHALEMAQGPNVSNSAITKYYTKEFSEMPIL